MSVRLAQTRKPPEMSLTFVRRPEGTISNIATKMRSWELEYSVMVTNTCVILDNLIVCMKQNGYFPD